MTAAKYDMICYQGALWGKSIGFKQLATDEGYIDISGWSFEMQIYSAIGGTLLHDLTPDIVLNDANTLALLSISAADTAAIDLTGLPTKTIKIGVDSSGNPVSATGPSGVYDLFSIDGDGNRVKRLYGLFVIHQSVTEPAA